MVADALNICYGSTSAAEGFTVGSEPADHVSNCRVDARCPVNKAYLFF